MKRTGLIVTLLASVLANSGAAAESRNEIKTAEGHPNIILFLVDDMGLMDTSVPFVVDANGEPVKYPLNEFYRTPNMEKLAEAGTRFTSFYAHSVCSPTRSSIMTGQNAARHRTTTWIKPEANNRGEFGPADWCWTGLDKTHTTLPRLLKTSGYRTIHVGKAHFGPNGHEGADPLNLGFDVNVGGFSAGQPGSYYGEKNYAWKGVSGQGQVPHLEKYHGTDVFLTEALTLEANRHIENAVKEKKPFFLYMSHYAVHAPFESDPRFAKNYVQSGKDKRAQAYGTLIEGMDKSLGDLLKKVRSLNVADNTLIIFLGDNGSAAPLGHTDYTSSSPFRGKKAWRYEGGMRVPFIAAWAKTDSQNKWQSQLPIPAGAIQTQTGTIMDILPTICNLAGVKLPKGMPLDGYNLKQQLAGKKNETRKEDFLNHFPHNHRNSYFTSYVNGDWKVIYHYPVPAKGGSSEPSQKSRYELYNLKDDPFESTDLANSYPERLQTIMGALIKDLEAKNALYPEVGKKQLRPVTPDELRKSTESQMPTENPNRQDAVSRVQTHPYIKTVKASSFQAGNPPVHAVDADTTSRWAARDGSFPQFLEVELKAPQQVNGVTLTFRNKTVIQYTIDVLGADGKWKTIVDQSENDKEVQTVTHSLDADISKLKVSVLYARQGWATITDLQMTFPKGKRHSGQ